MRLPQAGTPAVAATPITQDEEPAGPGESASADGGPPVCDHGHRKLGGIGGLAPERRQDLARFGLRAVLGGTIATLMTATIAGVLTNFG